METIAIIWGVTVASIWHEPSTSDGWRSSDRMARMVSGSSCTAPAAVANDRVLDEDDDEDDDEDEDEAAEGVDSEEDATLALGDSIVSRTPSAAAGGAISP